MSGTGSVQIASYDLVVPPDATGPAKGDVSHAGQPLSESILASNVLWFCRLRWIVVGTLVSLGILGQIDELTGWFGLRPPGLWPFVAAGFLVLCNTAYLIEAHYRKYSDRPSTSVANLRVQIILDLLVLTVVVHFLGSIQTYMPFTYLFHIVLACVFLSVRQSLVVVLVAIAMLGACIGAESYGFIDTVSIFADPQPQAESAVQTAVHALRFPEAVGIWFVVWYLVSHLSRIVRARDIELAETNRRLVAAQADRSRHMLTMTHQLKAPFAAIYANIQLLLKGYAGPLSDEAHQIAEKIAARSRRLAIEIKEMLQLANLGSAGQASPAIVDLDLPELLNWCIDQVRPLAQERNVRIDAEVLPARIRGVEDYLKMLFDNLLANAVVYSYPGGRVQVQCCLASPTMMIVAVRDEGIGIPAEKLPHIFDEHYRTKEAVQHNKESSGLGLAIVRQVAQFHKISLNVQSQPAAGTTFTLWLPCEMEPCQGSS